MSVCSGTMSSRSPSAPRGPICEPVNAVREKERKAELPKQTKARGCVRKREKERGRTERGQREARPGDQRRVRMKDRRKQ